MLSGNLAFRNLTEQERGDTSGNPADHQETYIQKIGIIRNNVNPQEP